MLQRSEVDLMMLLMLRMNEGMQDFAKRVQVQTVQVHSESERIELSNLRQNKTNVKSAAKSEESILLES